MKTNISKERKFLIERLGYFRTKANLSARELSLRMGKSFAYIAKYENGDFNMPTEELLLAIDICGTTCEEFFADPSVDYLKNKELTTAFNALDEDAQKTIWDLIVKLKK